MLKPKSPQTSFFVSGNYLYDRIVPQDHLLRKINAVVDFSFVNDLLKDRYTPDFGRPAKDPEFMLRLCLLQYIYGDSDRQVEENARINLAYKYFLGLAVDEEPPDFSTLCCFRVARLGEEKFRQVFENIVQQCIDKGLVTGKKQIIDSTHIVADITINSLSGLVTLCRQKVLRDIEKQNPKLAENLGTNETQYTKNDKFARKEEHLEKEVISARTLLDAVTGELEQGSLEITPELVEHLGLLEKAAVTDRYDEAIDRLVSPVDQDARAGKKEHKSWAGYKGHVIVEEHSEIITAVETTPANKADGSQLKPLLKQQETAFDLVPEQISGDKAYGAGANLEMLDSKHVTGYLSLVEKFNRAGRTLFSQDDFKYNAENETMTCPAGCVASHPKVDIVYAEGQQRKGIKFEFTHRQCSGCELKAKCYPSNSRVHGRAIHINYYQSYYNQMKDRMESEQGKEAYRNRYKIEHKIADLARYCGMRRCRYRGLDKARIHTLLAATVSNIKRMARLLFMVSAAEPWQSAESPPQVGLVTC